MTDNSGRKQSPTGAIATGAALQIATSGSVQLGNRGDTIILTDPTGQIVDRVAYTANQVHDGRTICFGR